MAADISTMVDEADCSTCESIDGCVQHIADECFLRLGVQVSPDVVMANFAHICPHVVAPSLAAAFMGLMSRRMVDVVGCAGAKWLRTTLAKMILRAPGLAADMNSTDLLQELIWKHHPHGD